MDAIGKRSGKVIRTEFESSEYLAKLEPVVNQLDEDVPDAEFDERKLAMLVCELMQFQEDTLGKDSNFKRQPKLPMACLRDYSPTGALYQIAVKCDDIMAARDLKRIEWLNNAKRKENMEILIGITKELDARGLLRPPCVHLEPSLGPDQAARLADIVKRMGGTVADTPGDPRVTHRVYPHGPAGDPFRGKHAMNTLETRGDMALVHWSFLPDSYDECVLAKHAPPPPEEPPRPHAGPWRVYMRWVRDSEVYNEWMNPADYETEEAKSGLADPLHAAAAEGADAGGVGPSGAAAGAGGMAAGDDPSGPSAMGQHAGGGDATGQGQGQGRGLQEGPNDRSTPGVGAGGADQHAAAGGGAGAAGGGAGAGQAGEGLAGEDGGPPAKRLRMEVRPEVEEGAGVRVGPNAVLQRVLEAHRGVVDGSVSTENLSQGQLPPMHGGPAPPRVPRVQPPPGAASRPSPAPPRPQPPQPPAALASRRDLYMVPSYASWLNLNGVHAHERAFASTINMKLADYTKYREVMVHMYREDPQRRLTSTHARERLQGDASQIHKVWSFLDYWGIINFLARDGPGDDEPPNELLAVVGPRRDTLLVTQALTAAPGGLFAFSRPTMAEAVAAATSGGSQAAAAAPNLATRRNQLGRSAAEPPGTRPQFFCNAMPWVDCSDLRYHCTKYPDIDLCPEAFAEGRFPPGTSAKDFVRIDARTKNSVPTASSVASGPPHGAPGTAGTSGAGGPLAGGGSEVWSQQETLLLLEGLEMFGDNWAEVAEHVGTKSQIQCIMHFLQLPIEDQFLDDMEAGAGPRAGPVPPQQQAAGGLRLQQRGNAAAAAAAAADGAAGGGAAGAQPAPSGESGPDPFDPDLIPFGDAGNPVMAQLAFLATIIGPRVAAAAAQRALEVMSQDDPVAAADAEAALRAANGDDANADGGGTATGAGRMDVDVDAEEDAAALAGRPPAAVPVSHAQMKAAAAAGLAAAAVRAKLLADAEEREIIGLMAQVVEVQGRKVEVRLRQLEGVEKQCENEKRQLEASRAQLEQERAALREARRQVVLGNGPQAMQHQQGGGAGIGMQLAGGPAASDGMGGGGMAPQHGHAQGQGPAPMDV